MIPKNNKGFSFVEMLTITVILAIVALAAYPVILAIVKSSKTKAYEQNITVLERASKNWAVEHADTLPNDFSDARFLTIPKLEEQGYLKSKYVYDPRTDKVMTGCIVVKKNDQEQYVTNYTKDKCEVAGKKYVPKVRILENSLSEYELNSTKEYVYPKLRAETITNEKIEIPLPIIKKNGKVVSKLKNNRLGDKYTIVYNVRDPYNDLVTSKEFPVEIVDTKAPVITVLNQTKGFDEEIFINSEYIIPEATVIDNSKKKIKVSVSTNLNTKMKGNYEVIYKAIDSSDNIGLLVMNVKVSDDKLLSENDIIISNASVLPGDGKLVKESNSEYVFKGVNPNNYIKFNDSLWRIIKLDQNGIKIIKDEAIKKSLWNTNMSVNFGSSIISRELKDYYQMMNKKNVNTINWNIGSVDINNYGSIDDLKRSESILSVKKEEMVGLINLSDYLNASFSNDFKSYLSKSDNYFTLQTNRASNGVYTINNGLVKVSSVSLDASIYPVVYLKGYKTLLGTGSVIDPYIINN